MNRFIAIFITMILLVSVFSVASISVNAQGIITEQITELPVDGTTAQGEFTADDNANYFKFTLETAGMVYFEVKSNNCPKNQAITGTVYNEDSSR